MTTATLNVEENNTLLNIFSNINRVFNRIGYARAASELRRAGYQKEADNCIKLMNNL